MVSKYEVRQLKRYFAFVFTIAAVIVLTYKFVPVIRDKASIYKDGVSYVAMVDDKYFYINKYGKWDKEFIKGVNVGAGKPGAFPGELAITKDEYLRWFKNIGKMNANTIRVYTILNPEFYEALYEYNKSSFKPIYVMQGVWLNEEDILKYMDVYNPAISNGFQSDIKTVTDIIHGNCVLAKKRGHAGGVYKRDVSKYITGWILGIEWDPYLVDTTNKNNQNKRDYKGKYIYTENASPFETWLTIQGDYAIKYETEKYGMQRPLSFVNWLTTDVLKHPNEPMEKEDMVSVNFEHIKRSEYFKPGLFASYHIYPYYPDFINYDKKYSSFKDKDGKVNPYRAYLRDLIKEHSMPVLVAEFGVPSSRGMAHVNIHTGYNQGNIDEKTQGIMDAEMLKQIYEEGYAGGLIFTWQDEWFKRTWNNMDYDIADRRPYWSNTQTNEQQFGVLSFDPGEKKSKCYVDGDLSDWKADKPILEDENTKLYIKSDEKYVYFMCRVKDFSKNQDKLFIPIDIKSNQGNNEFSKYNIKFKKPADFVIMIDGDKNSRIFVDEYYDSFYYTYSGLDMIPNDVDLRKNSGIFKPMYLCLNRPLYLPENKITLPLQKYETGLLKYGNGNPKSEEFSSLSDFYISNDVIEIRIPWQLLNVMDPSAKMIMDDFYIDGIKPIKTNGFYTEIIYMKDENIKNKGEIGFYSWNEWETPVYHERLKQSYYILKDAFKRIGSDLN